MPRSCLLIGVALSATGCSTFRDCTEVDVSGAEALPGRLSQTGLYDDIAADVISDAARAFEPQFPLWTDGASKRRWLVLPEGASVDTQDPDAWQFPVGTQFFKEFTRDGVRIETRLNARTEAGWAAVTYLWNDVGDDALRQLVAVPNAADTPHDVPRAGECLACHGGRGNFTLGFSATQLDVAVRAELYATGVLSDPVTADLDLPPDARAGLGTLHGNCSHCHNPTRNDQALATTCFQPPSEGGDDEPLDFTLPADLASVDDAPALVTGRWLVGRPGNSEILDRMSRRNRRETNASMPPLGTELVDDEGLAAVEAWIAGLPSDRD